MSPWVATTRFSLVATMTLQPVPQKRHAALSHFSSLAARSVTRLAASAGAGKSAGGGRHRGGLQLQHLAAIELCGHDGFSRCRQPHRWRERRARRSSTSGSSAMVLSVEPMAPAFGASIDDDELALGIAPVNFASGKRRDRGLDFVEPFGPRLHQHAGDLAAGRRDDAIRIAQAARDEGAAVDGRLLSWP